MNILFVGDVVGQKSAEFLNASLPQIKREYSIDMTIVNGENSVGHIGAALSERLHNPGDLRYLKTDFTQIITLCKHAFCLVKIVQRAVIQNHDPIRYTRDILHAV